MEIIKKIYANYKEIISYIFFGALNTAFNFIIYLLLTRLLSCEEIISNISAWLFSILFAFFTNKFFVFNSKNKVLKEMMLFFIARVLTCIICNILLFSFLIEVIKWSDIISKVITQVLIIILNYIISKVIVFNKCKKY